MKRILLFITILLTSSFFLSAQYGRSPSVVGPCDSNEGGFCNEGFQMCDLTTVTNLDIDMSMGAPNGPGQPSSICNGIGIINNVTWIQFTANSTYIEFLLNATNCTDPNGNGPGIQYGVFDGCDFNNNLTCSADANVGAITIASGSYEIGVNYYLFIDGYGGSVCNLEVELVAGNIDFNVADVPVDPIDFDGGAFDPPLTGNDVCLGSILNINVGAGNTNPDNTYMDWTISPFTNLYPDGKLNGEFETNTTQEIRFTELGVFDVCVKAYNCCNEQDPPSCYQVEVVPLPVQDFGTIKVCRNELDAGYIPEPPTLNGVPWQGGEITDAGAFTQIDIEEPSYSCLLTQKVVIEAIELQKAELVEVLLCPGETYSFCGTTYGTDQADVLTCPGIDKNGCDSIIDLTVIALNIQGVLEEPVCKDGQLEFKWTLVGLDNLNSDDYKFNLLLDGSVIQTLTGADLDSGITNFTVAIKDGQYSMQVIVDKFNNTCPIDISSVLVNNASLLPKDPELDMWDLNPCIQDEVKYDLTAINDPTNNYIWTLVEDPSLIVYNNDTTFVKIDWKAADPSKKYKLCVKSQNSCGDSKEVCETIEVTAKPNADFSVVDSLCLQTSGQVAVNTPVVGGNYTWTLGGGTSNPANPTSDKFDISFTTPGKKQVSLQISQGNCISDLFTKDIEVVAPLTPPNIQCSSVTDSIGFSWPDIGDDYIITVISKPGYAVEVTEPDGKNSFAVTNLKPNDKVEIRVEVIDNGVCANVFSIKNCEAKDCPPVDIQLKEVPAICLDNNASTVTLEAIVQNPDPNPTATIKWLGKGIDDPDKNEFNPESAGVGTHTITYSYETSCPYSETMKIEVLEQPVSTFEIPDEICIKKGVDAKYTGTFSFGGTFDWNFNDANTATNTGVGPHNLTWTTSGEKTVELQVANGTCKSEPFEAKIMVHDTIEAFEINCDEKTNDVTFSWPASAQASGYKVIINNVDQGEQMTTDYKVDGLQAGQDVAIVVEAISNNSCDNLIVSKTCAASLCPPVEIELAAEKTSVCLTDDVSPFQITPTITGGQDNPVLTWSGPGVDQNGMFDPKTAGPGVHTIELLYKKDICEEKKPIEITVHKLPVASFKTEDVYCETDNIEFVFDGEAGTDAIFQWQLSNGELNGTNPGPFTFTMDATGQIDVELSILENGCTSKAFTKSFKIDKLNVFKADDFECNSSTNEIDIKWNALDCIKGYEVYLNNELKGTVTALDFKFDQLNKDTEYDIKVIALSDCACGNTEYEFKCSTSNCADLNITIEDVPSICLTEDVATVDLKVDVQGTSQALENITWSGSGVQNTGFFNPKDAGAGVHTVSYSFNIDNCDYMATKDITVYELPSANISSTNLNCPQSDDGSIKVEGTGGSGTYQYYVDNVQVSSNEIKDLKPGSYVIKVEDQTSLCIYEETVTIQAPVQPTLDISGSPVVISGTSNTYSLNFSLDNNSINSIAWFDTSGTALCQPSDCEMSVEFAPVQDTRLCVLVEYNNGCSEESCIDIRYQRLNTNYIPNTFTPNGDGTNDTWIFYPSSEVESIEFVRVYDRWGELVFEAKDVPLDGTGPNWDGSFKSKALNTGVYLYRTLVKFKNGEERLIMDDLTIQR